MRYIVVDAKCIRETEDAILVVIEEEEYWIPKSQIHDDSEVYEDGEGNEGSLIVAKWLAKEKGIDGENYFERR